MRALARLPEYRPASAAALARELRAASGELPVEEPHAPPAAPGAAGGAATEVLRRPRRSVGRGWALATITVASLAALLLAVALVRGGGNDTPPPAAPVQVEPVPRAGSPEEQARALADWIRGRSG